MQDPCIDNVYTFGSLSGMARSRPSPSTPPPPAPVPDHEGLAGTKGSINLRIETQTRRLIDDAAAVLGKTRTEFMIDSARAQAVDVLLDQRLFVFDAERHDAFVAMLDNPPPPGPRLKKLLRRPAPWNR